MMLKKPSKISYWSAFLGNFFEHYDSALFGFLSPFLAPLLFPKHDPLGALIITYAIIPLGMLAKPLGALILGYIGDRKGRDHSLFISLMGMGIVSVSMGFCPTYAQIGILAPLLIYWGKLLQNFFAAGEISGAGIFLLEQTAEKKQDVLSGFYNASTIGGILLASAGVSWLCLAQRIEEGWRWLYFWGFITALFGLLIRLKKTPSFQQVSSVPFKEKFSQLVTTLKEERKALFLVAIVSGFSYANYAIALVLLNGFVPLISDLSKEEMITLNTSLLFLDFCTLPLFGWIASKVSREKLMIASSCAVALFAMPLFLLMENAGFVTVLLVRVCFVLFGVSFCAPFYSWAQHLVPSKNRYIVISFGYALGSQLIGSPTASISLWLFKTTGMISSVAWYWIALALGSSAVILVAAIRKKANQTFSALPLE